ncbi:capsid protein [Psittaciform chaphamaparvovirus 3]|nr:capsid protein [Psittaciform chaphamaparvovirus 3]
MTLLMYKPYLCIFLSNRIGKNICATYTTGMADDWHVTNTYMTYISNQPFQYPNDQISIMSGDTKINTGWGVIPNLHFSHFMTPKQWVEFVIQNEAYTVVSASCTVFNMIPMTTQLAIQGTNIFTAFNNTIYALGYKDSLYETSWMKWLDFPNNLFWKEGLAYTPGTPNKVRASLPIYQWELPHTRTTSAATWAFKPIPNGGYGVWPAGYLHTEISPHKYQVVPSGVVWDPFNMPSELMELRPGKNAITFSWEMHECDQGRWFNLDRLASFYPHMPEGPYPLQRPGAYPVTSQLDPDRLASKNQNDSRPTTGTVPADKGRVMDYTIANYADLPIVPCGWFWEEISHSIIQDTPASGNNPAAPKMNPILKPNMFYPGTEFEKCKYPPTQWFLKMIPLFDVNNTLVEITANVSIKMNLHLKVKKRRSAIYAPTWGPIAWKNVYSASTGDKNYIEAYIRYRTGGARRTWQNICGPDGNDTTTTSTPLWIQTGHPRVDPYDQSSSTVSATEGIANTRITYTTATAKQEEHLQMTFSTLQAPIPQKRKVQIIKQPSPELPINDLTFYPQNMADTQL